MWYIWVVKPCVRMVVYQTNGDPSAANVIQTISLRWSNNSAFRFSASGHPVMAFSFRSWCGVSPHAALLSASSRCIKKAARYQHDHARLTSWSTSDDCRKVTTQFAPYVLHPVFTIFSCCVRRCAHEPAHWLVLSLDRFYVNHWLVKSNCAYLFIYLNFVSKRSWILWHSPINLVWGLIASKFSKARLKSVRFFLS